MQIRSNQHSLDPQTREFYRQVLGLLSQAQVPYLLGGAYALEHYTGISRHTKDLDLFVRPQDCQPILDTFAEAGYSTELTASHWLGKAFCNDDCIDVIFNSASGHGAVDDLWFEYATSAEILGMTVQVCPVEEMLWSKSFVMARDRYDGADVAHLLRACADWLDWSRLLNRFGSDWRICYSHLLLFGFIYPGERSRIPNWVMETLTQQLQEELKTPPPEAKICQGPLLSALHYQIDIEQWGYQDVRLHPRNIMTEGEILNWTTHLEQGSVKGQ